METITVREVELLTEGGAKVSDVKLVRVKHKRKTCYEIEFTLHTRDAEKPSILITTRNEPHRWVDLNRACAFVEELFPDNNEMRLLIN